MTNSTEQRWAELVQQYKDGTINDQDRFLLEKKALDDPFLFDALEGYALHYNQSKATTSGSKSEPKTSIFNIRTMAAAASLVGLVALVFFMKNNVSNDTAASDGEYAMVVDADEENKSDDQPESTPTTANESIADTKPEITSGEIVQPKPGNDKKEKSTTTTANTNSSSQKINAAPQNETIDEEELQNRINNYTKSKPKITRASRVVEKDVVASNDEATDDMLAEKPSVPVTTPEMSEEEAKETLEESMTFDADAARAKKEVTSAMLVPVIGKSTFDEFVAERIEARGLRQADPVSIIIEFSIDENGRISDFKSLSDGCPACSAFAISLLQESGEWKTIPPAFEGRGTYEIKF